MLSEDCVGANSVMPADARTGRRVRIQTFRLLAAVCFLLLWLAAPAAAQAGQRLILKDGSWQQILKYEKLGDRTRYFSTLRREWEELPSELVDWKATEEWNTQPMQLPLEEERPGNEADLALTVAPGLQLPDAGGVFILDTFSGHPSLVELVQVAGALNRDTGGIFHSGVSSNGSFKQRLELRGLHARTQAHVPLPLIYVKIAEVDQPRKAEAGQSQKVSAAERFRIVKLEPKKNSRILASVDVTMSGKQSETQQFVPAHFENFTEGWLKVVPTEDLKPGEYAVVEMLDGIHLNSYAWDFGIDPNAPGNLNSRTAYSAPSDERGAFSPELKPRQK